MPMGAHRANARQSPLDLPSPVAVNCCLLRADISQDCASRRRYCCTPSWLDVHEFADHASARPPRAHLHASKRFVQLIDAPPDCQPKSAFSIRNPLLTGPDARL